MVELSPHGSELWRSSLGGDTLNMAWYARQALGPGWEIAYFTMLGPDALSERMVEGFQIAQLSTRFVSRHPDRVRGHYMIGLRDGERSYTYWRDNSAERRLADDMPALETALGEADPIYVTGITLAIPPSGRRALIPPDEAKHHGC